MADWRVLRAIQREDSKPARGSLVQAESGYKNSEVFCDRLRSLVGRGLVDCVTFDASELHSYYVLSDAGKDAVKRGKFNSVLVNAARVVERRKEVS